MAVFFQQLPKIIFTLVCLLIVYQLARLTWAIYPVAESRYSWVAPAKGSITNQPFDTQELQDLFLFGELASSGKAINEIEITEITEAPKTRLNLTLVGIIAATQAEFSSAIIEYKGQQESYFIDSMIGDTNAKVKEIYNDRIILLYNGQKQTLDLDGLEQDNARMASIEKQQGNVIPKNNSTTPKKIALDRKALLNDPGKLTDFIRISPVREGHEIKGYRVNPGKDPTLFTSAGLKAGDLAIELNGVDLTDMSQAIGLMKEFPTMKEINLTVDRDGQLNELFFSIP